MTNNKDEKIKIYVASLEAYNSGRMVGDWITPCDYSDYESFQNAIKKATKNADEVAVHDYEGINLHTEYPDFEKLYEFAKGLEDSYLDNEVIFAFAEHTGEDPEFDLIAKAEDYYVGTFENFREYADDFADEMLGQQKDSFLTNYFDYESYARDLEYDFIVCHVSGYNVAIFNNC
tara:strand:+ start:11293 stop:11817 length:525 start_codon:yes stop_codon:yes gene_type:complete